MVLQNNINLFKCLAFFITFILILIFNKLLFVNIKMEYTAKLLLFLLTL